MLRLFLRLAFILALVGGAVYAWENRVDPSAVSDAQYHKMATEFDGGVFEPLPAVKSIVIRPVCASTLDRVQRFFSLMLNPGWEKQAYYDDAAGSIVMVGDQPCIEATLPEWMRPTFLHTLRHEYGHALLADWLRTRAPEQDATSPAFLGFADIESADPADFPSELQPVAAEYRTLPENVYGQSYYMHTFWEYFAESYARFLKGDPVPPATKEFLAGLATMEAE